MSLELQSGVGHGRQASVDGQGERIDHQASTQGRPPDTGEHGPVLEAVGLQRWAGHQPFRRCEGVGDVATRRLEEGQPHVVFVLEPDHDLLTDVHLGGFAAHDGGGQAHVGVLGQRHHGDHVRRIEIGVPAVLVHGVPDDGAPTGDDRGLPLPGAASRADGHGRMHERGTGRAALNAQLSIGAGGPEPLGGRRQLGQRPHRPARSPSLAMICGRSTVVRIPGSAAQTTGTALTARFAV